jgi:hypothetical protein
MTVVALPSMLKGTEPGIRREEGFVHYLTIIRYRPRTTEARLQALTARLEQAGCRVKRDPLWTQFYVEVPDELGAWLEAQGLDRLLAEFADTVAWTRHIARRSDADAPDA